MSEAKNRSTIEALVAALNARDLAAMDRVFTEDVVMEWPLAHTPGWVVILTDQGHGL